MNRDPARDRIRIAVRLAWIALALAWAARAILTRPPA